MPIAGAAQGMAQSLDEIVAQRLFRQKLEAEIANQEQRIALEQSEQARRVSADADDAKYREGQVARQGRLDDRQASQDRQVSNQQGVRRMIGEAMTQRGTKQAPDRQVLEGMAFGEGLELPPEPKVTRHAVTTTGQDGKPLRKLVTEDELTAGVPEYRAPTAGPQPDYEWVIGADGKPRQIRKGTAQAGDRPYDAVNERKKPDEGGPSPYAAERATRTIQSVDELIGKVSRWTTGYGSLLANLPETDARNFDAELDTLKANIAFSELAQMREASKTGGALGAVAVREMELLQATLGALDSAQSPKNLTAQLKKAKASVQRWQQASANSSDPGLNRGVTADAGSLPDATAAAQALIEKARAARKPR